MSVNAGVASATKSETHTWHFKTGSEVMHILGQGRNRLTLLRGGCEVNQLLAHFALDGDAQLRGTVQKLANLVEVALHEANFSRFF